MGCGAFSHLGGEVVGAEGSAAPGKGDKERGDWTGRWRHNIMEPQEQKTSTRNHLLLLHFLLLFYLILAVHWHEEKYTVPF